MPKEKKTKKLNSFIRWFAIPFILFVLWIVLTLWYIVSFDQSALVLSYAHPKDSFTHFTSEKLLKGDKISGEFIAEENNLGIIALRFQKFERIAYQKEDSLRFRLKEKGAKQWYYQNNYRSGFIYDLPLLPIGFPLIADSKGKTYQFEMESLRGNSENAMALSKREPVLFSKYQFNKNIILSNVTTLAEFSVKKFVNSFQTIDIFYSSFVFLLPLVFYFIWNSPFKKSFITPAILKLQKKGYIPGFTILKKVLEYGLLTMLSLIIAIDIFILQLNNDLLYIVVAVTWLILCKGYRINSYITLITGMCCLILSAFFLFFSIVSGTEKALAWSFIFFVGGLFQTIMEINVKKKNNISK